MKSQPAVENKKVLPTFQPNSKSTATPTTHFPPKEPELGSGLEATSKTADKKNHFRRPEERYFTKAQRPHTTVLFEGFTWKHNKLMQGAMEAMGYKAAPLPTANVNAYQTGREFGNNGQCSPTYFTVGNLVQHLQHLEKSQGLTKQEVCDKYVFFTVGACGPCRFGMYEAEYRLALQNSGFGDFRVLIVGKSAGFDKKDNKNDGLDLNVELYLDMLNAILTADLVNEISHRIRPFEVEKGATDKAVEFVMNDLYQAIRECPESRKGLFKLIRRKWPSLATYLGAFWNKNYFASVRHAFRHFENIKVDRTRAKPVVKITGEFWAQMTEGDGNYNMFRFLEQEGAEVRVETIGGYIMHLLHENKANQRKRLDLDQYENPNQRKGLFARWKARKKIYKTIGILTMVEKLFNWKYRLLSKSLGDIVPSFSDMKTIEKLATGYYTPFVGGGETHLEVGKNIYYQEKNLAHMVLSMKPFGCMPSTQSDGVQSAVVSHYGKLLYLPIETSGEGEINAHSRVQMILGEAKERAREETRAILNDSGFTLEQVKQFVDQSPELQSPFFKIPNEKDYIGHSAHFLKYVTDRMKQTAAA